MSSPLISVIIPTFNRAALLEASLESLARQSLPRDQYEVIVVNDGSIDETHLVCAGLSGQLRMKYFYIEKSGNSAAKNLGIFASCGPLLLFFDDDDIASDNLLEEHLRLHRRYPQEGVAVLGYTTWAPALQVTAVMHYITDIGQLLFAYRNLRDGQELDFTYFWCGRSSCKRSLLVRHGVFNQAFLSIIEDIELGYRLSHFGLKVIFNRSAVQNMNRPVTYDEFCRRCERQGHALYLFSEKYRDPLIQKYTESSGSEERWQEGKVLLEGKVRRVRELENILVSASSRPHRDNLLQELHNLYGWTFRIFKTKGFLTEKEAREKPARIRVPSLDQSQKLEA